MRSARSVQVRGIVQGVGFRPFVLRLARAHSLAGWVLNEDTGVAIYVEGPEAALAAFLHGLENGRRRPHESVRWMSTHPSPRASWIS